MKVEFSVLEPPGSVRCCVTPGKACVSMEPHSGDLPKPPFTAADGGGISQQSLGMD